MKNKRIKNPLIRRIPRKMRCEWRKYLVVELFLILTIGFVSGMYVANGSMIKALEKSISRYMLEDGHFELSSKADEDLISNIRTGVKADVKQYYLNQAKEELDKKYGMAFPGIYEESRKKIQDEIEKKYADAEEKYELNDPDFKTVPVRVYENFYKDEEEDNDIDGISDGTIRVYVKNDDVNLACLMDGEFPKANDEIAIDRMHADNAGIEVGDTILVGGESYKVVGLIAYVNYSTLHEKSTDLMFDALMFDVAMVTGSGFERLSSSVHYSYAWQYVEKPADEVEEKRFSDDFLKALLTQTVVSNNEMVDYIPRYANPAVTFATKDMGADKALGGVLLDILIVIIAFIFAITISNTMIKESQTIGALRASGYTKGELIRHYLSMPVIVTIISAVIGNLLGYSMFKKAVVSIYYNSYSLPSYETIWNPEAFIKTTVLPLMLMLVVNLIVIMKMMQHTPLQFLRNDLKKKKRKKAMRLPRWRFFNRFRLRIIFQNIPNYILLFVGVFFIMVMLAMAVGMPSTLNYYKENAEDLIFAKYQYVLKTYEDEEGNRIDTENRGAEKFCMRLLQKKGEDLDEEVSVYGISADSAYVEIADLGSLKENEVYISRSFQDKYGLEVGDTFFLDEKYENKRYEFKTAGIYGKCQSIAMFMPIGRFLTVFNLDEGEFSGYLSDTEITDIMEDNIATILTERDITKMCDQLDHSLGAYMQYFQFLCILLSTVMIYLLTKIIIEKNENAIAMTKILGYENREVASLYLFSTTIILLFTDAISVGLGALVMGKAWRAIMFEYSGWFSFVIEPTGYMKMFIFVLVGYLIVVIFDFNRIRKIPMDKALKNVE